MTIFLGVLSGVLYSICWVISSRSVLFWVCLVVNTIVVAVIRRPQ
jgi:hypothetical protein